jgi:hypothetical protein
MMVRHSEGPSGTMREIQELIEEYGLEEDAEHIIVPFKDADGKAKRRFLLKRRFTRILYAEGHYIDYPIQDVVRATVKFPSLPLSEALYLMNKENGGEENLPEESDEVRNT